MKIRTHCKTLNFSGQHGETRSFVIKAELKMELARLKKKKLLDPNLVACNLAT